MNDVRPRLIVLCLIGVIAGAQTATAQESTSAVDRARALFREGIELIDEERYQEAVQVFRRTLALHDAPTIVYNLGLALARSDRLVDATEHLRRVSEDEGADESLRSNARQLLDEIEARIGRVTISLEGDTEGTEVTIDGRFLSTGALAGPVEVDPGSHRIALRRGEAEIAFEVVEITEGASVEVTLTATTVPSPRETAERAEPEPTTRALLSHQSSGDITSEAWFWTLVAVGVLAIAGGVIAGVLLGGDDGGQQPVQGNLDPPFLDVLP